MKVVIRALSLKSLLSLLLFWALVLSGLPAAQASDQRVVDIVELTWSGANRPSTSVASVQSSLDVVRKNWLDFTSIQNSTNSSSIEFVYGRTASTITLKSRFDCDGSNFSAFTKEIRDVAYKQLGIAEYQDRYLVILVPNAGCIWMGRALIGNVKTKGGTLVLHNNSSSFVITHELGHSLGLGHTNLLRCASRKPDGPWSTDCKAVEYGGSIDVMGNVDTQSPLSVYHQWRMGLLDNSEIHQSWLDEKIELSASDFKKGTRAVFIKDGESSYWIEYRRPRAGVTYKPGIVIYRGDPPPAKFIESPNPIDLVHDAPVVGVSADIWMLNLDNYTYSSTGRSSGSMTLPESKSITFHSNKVSISFSPASNLDSVILNVSRRADVTPPPTPTYSDSQFWRFPEFSVLENGYQDADSTISYFEIKKNQEEIKLLPEIDKDFFPTYLAPISPSPTLKIKDLPEGNYSLQVRAVDVWGNVSDWSEPRQISIDRGAPLLSSTYRIIKGSENSSTIALSELRDPGSGLCETVLINPEGVVVARSNAKSAPELTLNSRSLTATKLQTFDCLGNGLQANFNATYDFYNHQEMRKIGRWRNVPGIPNASQCIGKCSAYLSSTGLVQVAMGAGSASISVGSKQISKISSSESTELRLSDPINIGKFKRSVKVEGRNYILYGVAKATVQLSQISNISRKAHPEDLSLADAKQLSLSNLGFAATDLEQGWYVLPMARGTTLEDPTLDLCSAEYPSDKARLERRQVTVSKVGSPYIFLSSEVVRYKSERDAKNALAELLANTEDCLKAGGGVETSGVFTKYNFISFPNQKTPYQISDKTLFVHTVIGEASSARTLLAFYQYDREFFTGLYVVTLGSVPFKADEITRWSEIAKLFAERLANFEKK